MAIKTGNIEYIKKKKSENNLSSFIAAIKAAITDGATFIDLIDNQCCTREEYVNYIIVPDKKYNEYIETDKDPLVAVESLKNILSSSDFYKIIKSILSSRILNLNSLINKGILTKEEYILHILSQHEYIDYINNEPEPLVLIKLFKKCLNESDFLQLVKNIISNKIVDINSLIKAGVFTREEYIKRFLSPNEYLDYIKNDSAPIELIKSFKSCLSENDFYNLIKNIVSNYIVDVNAIIKERILTQVQYDKFIITKDQHLRDVRSMIDRKEFPSAKFKYLIDNRILDKSDLKLSDDIYSLLNSGSLPPLEVPNLNIEEIPKLITDRTDIFVFGIASSGKSCFMAGLIYNAYKQGSFKNLVKYNEIGRKYANVLIQSVHEKRLIKGNAQKDLHYMNIDFMKNEDSYPLTFFEMAGELFETLYREGSNCHSKLNEYLFNSENHKVIFLVIDYSAGLQFFNLDDILQKLENNGTLKTTDAIAILVTKWDLCPYRKENGALKRYLDDNYKSLITLCEQYEKKYKQLAFNKFAFSLGDFNKENTAYTYNPTDSAKIYDWICEVAMRTNNNSNSGSSWNPFRKIKR